MAQGIRNTEADFWARLDRSGGPDACWPFVGNRTPQGYGGFRFLGKNWFAHRLAWTLTHGEIPDGLFICHRCDNPPCCNPACLFLGTPQDNVADMIVKGRRAGTYVRDRVRDEVLALHDPDASLRSNYRRIAPLVGCSTWTVNAILREHREAQAATP